MHRGLHKTRTKAPPYCLDPSAASTTAPRPRAARPVKTRAEPPTARASSPPPYRPRQLAQLVDTVPAGNGWFHEMKYDGYRLLVAVGGGTARAFTRSGLDWSDRFGPVIEAAAKLKVDSALIDGEAVEIGRAHV